MEEMESGHWTRNREKWLAQEEKSAEDIWGEANPAPLGKLCAWRGREQFPYYYHSTSHRFYL